MTNKNFQTFYLVVEIGQEFIYKNKFSYSKFKITLTLYDSLKIDF